MGFIVKKTACAPNILILKQWITNVNKLSDELSQLISQLKSLEGEKKEASSSITIIKLLKTLVSLLRQSGSEKEGFYGKNYSIIKKLNHYADVLSISIKLYSVSPDQNSVLSEIVYLLGQIRRDIIKEDSFEIEVKTMTPIFYNFLQLVCDYLQEVQKDYNSPACILSSLQK